MRLVTGKRLVAISLATALLLAACGTGTASPAASNGEPGAADLTLFVVGFTQEGAFWQAEAAGARQAGEDLGVRVNYSAPQEGSSEGMISLLEAAIAAEPDGIALNYSGRAMEAITTKALDAGIQVVLYNNNRFEGDNAPQDSRIPELGFSGQNESTSGEALATALLPHLPQGGGKVLYVNHAPQAFVLTLRHEGMARVLEDHGYTTDILAVSRDIGSNIPIIASYLDGNDDVVAVVGSGSPANNSAAQAVDQRGLGIPVAGFDIDREVTEHVANERMVFALNQQPFLQAYFAVQNLWLYHTYGFQPVIVNTGTSIVTKDNVDDVQRLIDQARG